MSVLSGGVGDADREAVSGGLDAAVCLSNEGEASPRSQELGGNARDVDGQGGCPHLDGDADRRARLDGPGVRVGCGRDLC